MRNSAQNFKNQFIMTAQELLDALIDLKQEWGTLDVPVAAYIGGVRYDISGLDPFTEGRDFDKLYFVDLNVYYHEGDE